MKTMGMGLDMAGNLLFPPMDEDVLAKALISALAPNMERVRSLTKATTEAVSFRGEIERTTVDIGDPKAAGWTFLMNAADPRREEIQQLVQPLAEYRGMADPMTPLLFNDESPDDWFDWMNDNYYGLTLDGDQVPQYILIVGKPDQIPFRFQSILDTVANVGRITFDSLDDLKTYIDKLIRVETASEPLVKKETVLFAPDAGMKDPTYYSREYMVKPLNEHVRNGLSFNTHCITGDEATKINLQSALGSTNPALVYTASHGLGTADQPVKVQHRYGGAICCQHTGSLTMDSIFSADDVPLDQPFLEGAAFFQFACYGYGTPAESDYSSWLSSVPPRISEVLPKRLTDTDFVAALPKKLLAHPRGPIVFIGHLDTAFLHGLADPEEPMILDRWHSRIAPFKKAVDQLLGAQPTGLAMKDMNQRYSLCNAIITNTYDRDRRGKLKWTPTREQRFVDNWIIRGDAQNYMVFGDPAARLRVPKN